MYGTASNSFPLNRFEGSAMSRVLAAALIFAGACVLAAVVVWAGGRPSSQDGIDVRLPEAATPTPGDGQLKVYVTGAVQRPGVYSIRPGDRVADAIEAASGPTEDADTININFARRLRDEDHITVPRKGDPLAISITADAPARRIDINTATTATLETLPGIGPSRAKSIIDSRLRDGPFTDPADLVKRKLLPQSVFDGLKDLIDIRP
jgi:competence protein ComEA